MMSTEIQYSRRIIARLICLKECIKALTDNVALPESLCYVPATVEYKCVKKQTFKIYEAANKSSKKTGTLNCTTDSKVHASGDDNSNSYGRWLRVKKFKESPKSSVVEYDSAWILLSTHQTPTDELLPLRPIADKDSDNEEEKQVRLSRWEDVVDQKYATLFPHERQKVTPFDTDVVKEFGSVPLNWKLEHDEAMATFMKQYMHHNNGSEDLGCLQGLVEALDVSSYSSCYPVSSMTDGNSSTFWESDGSSSAHWIQLTMRPGTVIKKLSLGFHRSDENYLPTKIVIEGGDNNMTILNTVTAEWDNVEEDTELTLLTDLTDHYRKIKIKFKECYEGGIDIRIRNISLNSTPEREQLFDRDLFKKENLVLFPTLECYSPDQLYRRSQVLLRLVSLVDTVLPFLISTSEYSQTSFDSLKVIRQLLPLSKKRLTMVNRCLIDTSTESVDQEKLYINRQHAMEHKEDTKLDPECKKTVFVQVYDNIQSKERSGEMRPLDYRWKFMEQWWECKFIGEGIIDQGGGFRDCLSDIAEELCPTNATDPVPLCLFRRSQNQFHEESSGNKDTYIVNPSCTWYGKYEWLGQLMGGCMRSKESLILTLSSFFWKKLTGEVINWDTDFRSRNEFEVRMLKKLEALPESASLSEYKWRTTVSNGTEVVIKMDDNGDPLPLKHEDISNYCEKVREIRMSEGNKQIAAIKKGLLKVIPLAVLELLTWQELELKVCGDPIISLDSLKRNVSYDGLEESDTVVKYLWEALNSFSNEERSKYLKFVTGRRRLPAPITISNGKSNGSDSLPESATCANTLFLPTYTGAAILEEKLRYAVHNCVAIDTDTSPYEDDDSEF